MRLPFSIYRIRGHSMEPNLKEGQVVLVNNWAFLFNSPQKNQIIFFKKNGEIFVKRIFKIEAGGFFVKGDNASDSLDSREFGLVKESEVIGKII